MHSWYGSWHTCIIATVEAELCSFNVTHIVYVVHLHIVFSKAALQKRGYMEHMEPPLDPLLFYIIIFISCCMHKWGAINWYLCQFVGCQFFDLNINKILLAVPIDINILCKYIICICFLPFLFFPLWAAPTGVSVWFNSSYILALTGMTFSSLFMYK